MPNPAVPTGQLSGHTSTVNSVAFSRDGHTIATGSDDRTVRLWDAHTLQPLGQPLTGHQNAVGPIAFTPDGKRVVSGAMDDTVQSLGHAQRPPADRAPGRGDDGWRSAPMESASRPPAPTRPSDCGTRRPINRSAHRSQDTRIGFLASRSVLTDVALPPPAPTRPSASGTPTHSTHRPAARPRRAVNSVAFSPDGHRIATGSDDKTVRIWNADTLTPIGEPLKHDAPVYRCRLQPGRPAHRHQQLTTRRCACGTPHTGQLLTGPVHHDYQDQQLSFRPDGRRIVAGSFHNTVSDLGCADPATRGRPARLRRRHRARGRIQPGRHHHRRHQQRRHRPALERANRRRSWSGPDRAHRRRNQRRVQPGQPNYRHRKPRQDTCGCGRCPRCPRTPYARNSPRT